MNRTISVISILSYQWLIKCMVKGRFGKLAVRKSEGPDNQS